jgi:hypothetical protein
MNQGSPVPCLPMPGMDEPQALDVAVLTWGMDIWRSSNAINERQRHFSMISGDSTALVTLGKSRFPVWL